MPSVSLVSYDDFLDTVLWQGGPFAVPYEENLKRTIKSDLLKLFNEFPSLGVKAETFFHNDGKSSNLLQAYGTISMSYLEVMYDIPVNFWLLEDYPKKPPRVFVTPTCDMIIKRPHHHVDASGLVSVPYLRSWMHPVSNLVKLARSLSLVFGQDLPVSAKPNYSFQSPHAHNPGAMIGHTGLMPLPSSGAASSLLPGSMMQPRPNMNPVHSVGPYPPSATMSQISSTSSYGGTPSNLSPHHPYSPHRHPTPSNQHTPSNQAVSREDQSSETFRCNTIKTLVERVQHDVAEQRKATETAMDKLANTQGILKQREGRYKSDLQELQQEKEALEQQLQTTLTNTDMLETRLRENKKSEMDVDIDGAFEPSDTLSKQFIECTSADLAIEDILYSLDKAVQAGVVPVDAYMKHVRNFAREQFFHRATAVKVRAAQSQLQVSAMADRAGSHSS